MKEDKPAKKEEVKQAHKEPVDQNDFKAMFSMASDLTEKQDAEKKARKAARRKNHQNFIQKETNKGPKKTQPELKQKDGFASLYD